MAALFPELCFKVILRVRVRSWIMAGRSVRASDACRKLESARPLGLEINASITLLEYIIPVSFLPF